MSAVPAGIATGRDEDAVYRARYLIAFAVVLASVMELVDTSIVNVAIPHMMGELGSTLEQIAWVSTGYIVANVIILPLTPFLSNAFGRRHYYVGSIILFTVASFFCGNAHSLEWLVSARIVQGIGGGALISTAQAILFDVFPQEERGMAGAIFGMGVMVGPTLGPTLGGWITDNYSWPWIFYVNIPLGILAAILCWEYVPEPRERTERFGVDWLGVGLLAIGIGCLQILLERGESKDWFASGEIIGLAVAAGLGLVIFIWHELHTDNPVVELRILKDRQLAMGLIFGAILGFALYASVFVLPVFLQNLLGYSAEDTGLVILPGALASAFTMPIAGKLADRMDSRPLIVVGVLLFLWSMVLHSHLTMAIGMHDLFWPMILRGVGLGLIFVPLTGITVASLGPRQMPLGTGLFNLSRQLGGSLGIAGSAVLVTHFRETAREGLRQHLDPTQPQVASWLAQVTAGLQHAGASASDAVQRAHALLMLRLEQQASVLAFERIFITMGLTFTLALPLLLFFRTGRVSGKIDVGH